MKLKQFFLALNTIAIVISAIIVVPLFMGYQTTPIAPEASPASDKYRLVWNDDPTENITVAWNQYKKANSMVMYGTKDHGRDFFKYEFSKKADRILTKYKMTTHFAKLSKLKPDQVYYFVIKDDTGVSERYWFRTAPDKPKAFTFIAGGDTKSADAALEAGRASNRIVAKLRPLFVMFNGDFCSGNGTVPEYWHTWLNDWHKLTTTPDGRMIPIFPVHGNHENGDQANLNYIFNAPYQQNDSSQIYYSLSFGGSFFHIIALNSSIDEGGNQRRWLENDLKTHKNYSFKIAGYHKPFWPHTNSKAENKYQYNQWAHLFYDYGLDISMDGDSHLSKITFPLRPESTAKNSFMGFVRDDAHGTIFMGEGSWGAHPRATNDDKPWTLKSFSGNQIKWIHVVPKENRLPDRMNIYTIITATYDKNNKQTLYDKNITGLSEYNLFDIPDNLKLLENGKYGEVIKYPFRLN